MTLAIFSHKPCWRSDSSPTGFATDGGFPFQVAALAELFEETLLVVPVYPRTSGSGEVPLQCGSLRIVPLLPPFGSGLGRKLLFPIWLLGTSPTILSTFFKTDAVHAPIPGDMGTVGMLLAWTFRKPLFVRHCGNWLRPVTFAEKFWRWFMEAFAGGRNVMLATGGADEPPSGKNSAVRWIFSTSLTQRELDSYASLRSYPFQKPGRAELPLSPETEAMLQRLPTADRLGTHAPVRLIIVARQEKSKGAGTVIRTLPLLAKKYPGISFDIVGDGSAIAGFKELAKELGVEARVNFTGKLNHEQVMQRLQAAHIFVFPTTSSDGFPKAVLEGLASGLPVVATRVSVLPQLLGNGCGVLVDQATPEAVTHGIEQALSDPARYQAMSRKAIETARQFSLESWRDTIGSHLASAWGPLKGKAEDGRPNVEN